MSETCPRCGVDGYENIGPGTPRICADCGYDDEHGDLSCCVGCCASRGRKPVCCDTCWQRAPRDLPEWPRWRSRRRARSTHPATVHAIDQALAAWLREHFIPRRTTA